jgi:hypothetical protein
VRLGRESFRFAWHEGHCKFSVRANTRTSGTFPKHNGQARFHMVVKFVSFFLRHLGMPRPERSRADTVPCRYSSRRIVAAHLANRAKQGRSQRPQHPERSPIRARVASVKRVLVIQLDHDLGSFARVRPLWGASSTATFGESQRILAWFGVPKRRCGAGNAGERRLLGNPGPLPTVVFAAP